jgi:hypothetical protein
MIHWWWRSAAQSINRVAALDRQRAVSIAMTCLRAHPCRGLLNPARARPVIFAAR